MSLFSELKRRNVFKVAASYAIVAWIVLQVADTTFPALNIPAWVMSLITILILLGFPIAMFMAWAFEMTPEGIKPTAEVPLAESIRAQTGQKMNLLTLGGVAVLLVLVAVDRYVLDEPDGAQPELAVVEPETATPASGTSATEPVTIPEKSIAVLPFSNQSDDADQEYFSDGLTDELINKLSQVNDLLVIGRNSSFYFKDRSETLQEIGRILDAAYILQGSVRKAGDQVRVTAQLMNAQSGYNLWSRTYDRTVQDIFALQDEIAGEVTTALSVSLGAGEFNRIGMTRDIAAYDAYLKGLSIFQDEGLEPLKALEYMQQAVTIDPQFALAWAAQRTIYQFVMVTLPPDQRADFDFQQLRQEAGDKAIALAPDMPEALTFQAEDAFEARNWLEADRLYRELLATHGTAMAEVNRSYGRMLSWLGKSSESLAYLQRARRLSPVGGMAVVPLASSLLNLGRVDEALVIAEQGLMAGEAGATQFLTAIQWNAAFNANQPQAAVTILEGLPEQAMEREYVLPVARLLAQGDQQAALAKVRELATDDLAGIERAALQVTAAMAGDQELAVELLGTSIGLGQIGLWQPLNSEVRQSEKFKQGLIDLGVCDYLMATGWNDFCHPLPDTENDFECN